MLRKGIGMGLTHGADVERLRGLGDELDLREVEEVYLPLSRLLHFYVEATYGLHLATSEFLGERPGRTPFVIGVAGSVAAGKSTTARILKELLSRWPHTPSVELVTTDGFLLPNAELERRGILHRKGFPESYDRRALLRFVSEVKAGRDLVRAPVYSHLVYDIVPGEFVEVTRPDVLIVESVTDRVQDQGTEMLHHYEGDLLRLTHPARRCTDCASIITAASAGGRCHACADGLHMESHTNATYTRDQIGTAANRAADLYRDEGELIGALGMRQATFLRWRGARERTRIDGGNRR